MSRALMLMLVDEVLSHGMLVRPIPRANIDADEALDRDPGCVGNGCLYFTRVAPAKEATNNEKRARTWNIEEKYLGDYTKLHPWRAPGHVAPGDPCGCRDTLTCTERGSQLPVHEDKVETWIAGGTAWAWWSIQLNHGGGYQFRLCPKSQPLTNECFEAMPLQFSTSTYTIRYDGNLMAGTPDVIAEAVEVTVGTKPAGSTWRRLPIPNCNCDQPANHCAVNPKYNSRRKAYEQQTMPSWYKAHRAKGGYECDTGFQFPPPAEGVYGLGASGNTFNKRGAVFRFGDELRVPEQEGEYVLQWRWDTEEQAQIWSVCADIRITAAASNVTV